MDSVPACIIRRVRYPLLETAGCDAPIFQLAPGKRRIDKVDNRGYWRLFRKYLSPIITYYRVASLSSPSPKQPAAS